MKLKSDGNTDLYLLGGTWGMQVDGRLYGGGDMSDKNLLKMQTDAGLLDVGGDLNELRKRELAFSQRLYEILESRLGIAIKVGDLFGKTCPELINHITGSVFKLFSFDSSHKTPMIIAPLVISLIKQGLALKHNNIASATGTDTADMSELALYDVLTFDRQDVATLLQTGARLSIHEPNSDAPRNLISMAAIANNIKLNPGGYWVSDGVCFSVSDMIKIDPGEGRELAGQRTFFSPHRTHRSCEDLVNFEPHCAGGKNNLLERLTVIDLFEALTAIYTLDLGHQNDIGQMATNILHPQVRGLIVAGHGLGNGDNMIKALLKAAADQGKWVIITSRCMIPETTDRYMASLFAERYINAGKIRPAIAKYLLTRVIIDNLDLNQANKLFIDYKKARNLL